MLLRSRWSGFISPGLTCLCGPVAAAGSLYVQRVHQPQRQGKTQALQKILTHTYSFFLKADHLYLTVSHCQMSSQLIQAVQNMNTSSSSPSELSALSDLLSQLGASFLLSLPPQQLLEVLTQPGLHRYSPAQVSGEFGSHVTFCQTLVKLFFLHHLYVFNISV